MATRQAQVPGGAFVNETATRQAQVPGYQFVNETVTTGAAFIAPRPVIISQAVNRAATY